MYALAAGLGAALALGCREWVDYYQRRQEKMANCHHDYEEVPVFGEIKLICRRCPHQKFKGE